MLPKYAEWAKKLTSIDLSGTLHTSLNSTQLSSHNMPDNSESFEHALAELEEIVSQMESGEISLEASLEKFERGITLVRASQQQLSNAEQKVKILLSSDADAELADFDKENNA